jgi:hypothetical protein
MGKRAIWSKRIEKGSKCRGLSKSCSSRPNSKRYRFSDRKTEDNPASITMGWK